MFFSQGTWRPDFSANPTKPVLQAHVPIQNSPLPPVVTASSPYGAVSQQFSSLNSVPVATQIHQPLMNATSVNPILSQNVNNHQIMTPIRTEQSWAGQPGNLPEVSDLNTRFSHYQDRYSTVGNGPLPAGHVMPGHHPTWDGNHSSGRYTTDTWGPQTGPSRTGESSASWGYNEQRRDGGATNYPGQRWYGRDHDRRR